MKFEEFKLEREQSTWENKVDFNLSESGVHPRSIKTLFDPSFIEKIENTELTYGFTEGSPDLRNSIASIYKGANIDNVQAVHTRFAHFESLHSERMSVVRKVCSAILSA